MIGTTVCAQTFTSVSSGSYTDGATWGNTSPGTAGTDYPANNDHIIITNGTVVGHITNTTAGRVLIQSGGELRSDATLRVRGAYICNGTHSGSGQARLQSGNDTIAGSGAITLAGIFRVNTKRTIIEGANLLRQNGNLRCPNNDTLFNRGTLTLDAVTLAGNSTGSFLNAASGVVYAGLTLINNGTLIASATGNRIIYNRSGTANQNIKIPIDSYYDLEFVGTVTNSKRNIDGDFSVLNDLEINGPEMRFNGAHTVSIGGDFTMNSGAMDAGTGTIEMDGNSQSINGAFTFNNLTISNSTSVSIIGSGVNVEGILNISSGALTTGGNLTIISNGSGTGSIAELGGTISGNVTVQRHIPAGPTAWRFLSSPVNGVSYTDWQDDFIMSGFPGSTSPGFAFVSAYYYDESVSGAQNIGFTAPSNASNALQSGRGYFMWVGDQQNTSSAVEIDLTGSINSGSVSLPVTYTNNNTVVEDGWNVVGNPYASAIDWNSASWTKVNLDDAVYVWNADAGVYSSYVGGVGANGGSNIIPSSQAFFVKANAASPALTIQQGAKTSSSGTFLRPPSDQSIVTILMDDGQRPIETFVKVNASSTASFHPAEDAHFLAAPFGSQIYSSFGAERYSINAVSGLEPQVIPVHFTATESELKFTITIQQNDGTSCFAIRDELTGEITPVYNEEVFTLTNTSNESQQRFSLLIFPLLGEHSASPCDMVTGTDEPAIEEASTGVWVDGKTVNIIGSEVQDIQGYTLHSIGGMVLLQGAPDGSVIQLEPSLSSGIYLLELHSDQASSTHKIVVTR